MSLRTTWLPLSVTMSTCVWSALPVLRWRLPLLPPKLAAAWWCWLIVRIWAMTWRGLCVCVVRPAMCRAMTWRGLFLVPMVQLARRQIRLRLNSTRHYYLLASNFVMVVFPTQFCVLKISKKVIKKRTESLAWWWPAGVDYLPCVQRKSLTLPGVA